MTRPVAVFRFSRSEGPGHFAQWLEANGRPWRLVALDLGESVPDDPTAFAGIGMMGGPMGANDAFDWRDPLAVLLRRAVDARVPVIGHCLGGQVLSRALGGVVSRAATTEIGWIDVEATDAEASREWFGGRNAMTVFQWHQDAFTIPPGATRVLANAYNPNQAYVVDDRHIGMQCHIEMTAEMLEAWCDMAPGELPDTSSPERQSRADILSGVEARIASLNALADGVYARWARYLA